MGQKKGPPLFLSMNTTCQSNDAPQCRLSYPSKAGSLQCLHGGGSLLIQPPAERRNEMRKLPRASTISFSRMSHRRISLGRNNLRSILVSQEFMKSSSMLNRMKLKNACKKANFVRMVLGFRPSVIRFMYSRMSLGVRSSISWRPYCWSNDVMNCSYALAVDGLEWAR